MPVVLITNNTLAARAGTEMYVRDVALALLRRGWQPVACSSVLGDTAEELRRLSVPVVDDPRKLSAPPDLIHAHHHLDAMAAIAAWPGVPVIAFCHGWVPWEETPFSHPQIVRYVAVDELCRERLVIEHGVASGKVDLLLNFVDLPRFQPRPTPPPERPKRALVFSNNANAGSPILAAIKEACARLDVSLEVVGSGVGNPTSTPEKALMETDLVFAKGRASLEALAVGCGVVVADFAGLAGLVTPENYERFRRLNFGFRLMATSRPLPTADDVVAEIQRWSADQVTSVSSRVRNECGLDPAVERLVSLYEKALSQPISTGTEMLHAGSAAMAGYLLELGCTFKSFNERYSALAEAHHQSAVLAASQEAHRMTAHNAEIAQLTARVAAVDSQLARLGDKLSSQSSKIHAQADKMVGLQRELKRFAGVRRFLPRWLAEWKM